MWQHVVSYDLRGENKELRHFEVPFASEVEACTHFTEVKNTPGLFGRVLIDTIEVKGKKKRNNE